MNKSHYNNSQIENSIALNEIDKQRHEIQKKEAEEDRLIRNLEFKHQKEMKEALKNLSDNTKSTNNRSKQRVINNFIYKKDLSNIFKDFTQKQNIPFSRSITTRFNTTCYSGRTKGLNSINSLKTSIKHSIRSEKRNTLEWIDELSSKNLYFTQDKFLSHHEFCKQKAQHLSFMDELENNSKCANDINHKKELNRLSKLRSSYYHKIQNLLPKDHENRNKLFEKLVKLESKENKQKQINKNKQESYIKSLTNFLLPIYHEIGYSNKKIELKLRVLNNYLSYRFQHINIKNKTNERKIKNKNNTQIVEAVFKIPHRHGDFSSIDAKEFLSAGLSFYQKNFSNNKIHLAALHEDESKCSSVATGRNFHIFIDGNNGTDMTYRQQYLTFAKDYAKERYPDEFKELLSVDTRKKQTTKVMVLSGQVMQLAFLSHVQKILFNKYGIELALLDDSQRKEFNYIQACLEQHLPIEDRQQSRYNMLVEHSEELEKQLIEQNEKISKLEKKISAKQHKIDKFSQIEQHKLDNILEKINLWKLSKLPEIDEHLVELVNSEPLFKSLIIEQLELFEDNYQLTEEQKLSVKISHKPY